MAVDFRLNDTPPLRRRLAVSLALALVLAIARVAGADGPPTLEELAAAIDRASKESDGDRVVVGHISRTLGLSVETLRTERTRTGLGWGDLLITYRLSREAGSPFDEVVADLRRGQSWKEIVGERMDLATLVGEVQRSKEMIEARSEDKGPGTTKGPARTTPGGGTGRGSRRQ